MIIKYIFSKIKFYEIRSRMKNFLDKENFRRLIKKEKFGEITSKEKLRGLLNKDKYIDVLSQFKFKEINHENAILIAYIFSGLFLSLIIYSALNIPLSRHQKKLQEEVNSYQIKKNNIPEIKSKFKDIKYEAETLKEDRKFLINLTAGTKNLDTFMAVLNKKANRNFVKIIKFEPQNIEKFTEKPTLKNNSLDQNSQPPTINQNNSIPPLTAKKSSIPINENSGIEFNKNPLLIIPDIEKHDIKISLEGNYTQILSFIRDVELLENIVLIGDFEIIGLDDVSKVDNVRIRYNSKISVFGNIIIPPEKKQNI